jgi:hypothetical protein
MKRLGYLLFAVLPIMLMLGGNANATVVGPNDSFYFVTYYSNANTTGVPDATLRIVNDGGFACISTGVASGNVTCESDGEAGTLWAAIYVFDDSQEMISCCSCQITADGLLSESVNKELTANTFTGRGELTRGVIKVLSARDSDPASPGLSIGLRGWMTHIQATTTTFPAPGPGNPVNAVEKGPWFVTEDVLANSNLTELEYGNLGALCSYGLTIGSGYGLCPCTSEDYDF